jgi:hypothetical protein
MAQKPALEPPGRSGPKLIGDGDGALASCSGDHDVPLWGLGAVRFVRQADNVRPDFGQIQFTAL